MLKSFIGNKALLSLAALTAVALETGCGSSSSSVGNMVSGVKVSSSVQNGDIWASLTANLNTNSFILAGLQVPIVDPQNPSIEYGQISLTETLCTGSGICQNGGQLSLSVDLTAVAKLPNLEGTDLPNGTPIPLSGLSSLIALPIGNTNGKVYVDFSSGKAVIGVAFPFKALNSVGQYVPGLDIFDAVNFGSVNAYVGIFAGSQSDQTGIALLVDASAVFSSGASGNAVQANAVQARNATSTAAAPSSVRLQLHKASTYQEFELYTRLESLGRKHTVLKLQ
ncbi:MAG: hypothetical protein P4M08_03600 [Oligoflexia bacterium]|nr:hypothetical protein [Oligoflexia bacterium]